MVRHIVMWKYNEDLSLEKRDELFDKLDSACNDMNGNISGLIEAKLLKNANEKEVYGLCLVCDMENMEAVRSYQDDPLHIVFKNIITGNVNGRACIDAEI